ncbi:MAG: hypothetical protein IPK67_16945 [Planctomycetes bacterium]|jgi:hypothetical protein|nr:hypothetical protein [Planctomycetota bacterium]
MESFEKRQREKKKLEKQRAKEARRLQDAGGQTGSTGPAQEDYFADLNSAPSSLSSAEDAGEGSAQAGGGV